MASKDNVAGAACRPASWDRPSARSDVAPFIAMDVMAAAADLEADGRDIVHMEVGQPGAPAPAPVLAAARQALEDGRLGYTESRGVRPLRDRIARHYAETYGVDVPRERIVVTTGSSAGFNLAFLAAFDAGDRIAMAAPGYPAYRNIIRALGLVPVEIPVGPESRWVITADMVARARAEGPVDGLLIASPANPTGTVTAPEELGALVRYCDDAGIRFLSDEIYHGLVHEGRAETALRFTDTAVIINSFSKYYCMTGWRIGWMVAPETLVRPIERLAQSLYISAPDLSQRAAVHAFDAAPELEAIKAVYARNRALLLDRLPAIGFDEVVPADGAFYAYVSIARFSNDSRDFTARLLREAGVAATPGLDFDTGRGNRYVRFSFAGTEARIAEGLERLGGWLADRPR